MGTYLVNLYFVRVTRRPRRHFISLVSGLCCVTECCVTCIVLLCLCLFIFVSFCTLSYSRSHVLNIPRWGEHRDLFQLLGFSFLSSFSFCIFLVIFMRVFHLFVFVLSFCFFLFLCLCLFYVVICVCVFSVDFLVSLLVLFSSWFVLCALCKLVFSFFILRRPRRLLICWSDGRLFYDCLFVRYFYLLWLFVLLNV